MKKPTLVDVFCGAGGLSEGFRQAGFSVLLGVDSDHWSIRTYNRHHCNRGRINTVQNTSSNFITRESGAKEIDVLAGGPPCQAFSTFAIAKWRSLGLPTNVTHPLNGLYKEFLRLVNELRPKFFVIENVKRMLSIDEGAIRKVIDLEMKNKYHVSFQKKDAADFGVPQHRVRALIIGNRLGLKDIEIEHKSSKKLDCRYVTVREAISDLPKLQLRDHEEYMAYPRRKFLCEYAKKRRKDSAVIYNHVSRGHNERDLRIFKMLKPGQNSKHLSGNYNPYRTDIFRDRYRKQPWDRPASTIVAHLAKDGLMFIHPDKSQNRTLSPREAARLQSFDDRYVFEGPPKKQFIQIGNAVPPLFARSLALVLKKFL